MTTAPLFFDRQTALADFSRRSKQFCRTSLLHPAHCFRRKSGKISNLTQAGTSSIPRRRKRRLHYRAALSSRCGAQRRTQQQAVPAEPANRAGDTLHQLQQLLDAVQIGQADYRNFSSTHPSVEKVPLLLRSA